MIPLRHVAGLAGGCRRLFRQDPRLFEQMPDAMFGRGVHLPLRMVDSHVAGPAGLGFTSLLDGKKVARVAGIARRQAEHDAVGLQLLDLFLALEPDSMAAAAALHAFGHGHGEPMRRGHGVHADPGKGVLAPLELFRLNRMAGGADIGGRGLDQRHVLRGAMLVAMAEGTVHSLGVVTAQLPVRDDAGSHVAVALDAVRGDLFRSLAAA